MIHNIKDLRGAIIPFDCKFGSGIRDKNGNEIFDGDTLNIDFDAAQELIGDGSLVQDILRGKFNPNAVLVVKFYHARFRLCWQLNNGSEETSVDLSFLDAIKNFVEIVTPKVNYHACVA